MQVYKYFNSRYKMAIAMGFYYVNTFNNIRTQYENGLISDSTEGQTKNLSGHLLIDDSRNQKHQKAIRDLDQLGIIKFVGDGPNTGVISNCIFETQLPDAHLFCVTTERNDLYWQNLPENQRGPYDSCIEISDFRKFLVRLTHALTAQYALTGSVHVDNCFFESNNGTLEEGTTKMPSYFRKPEADDFKKQREMRAVLIPRQQKLLEPRTVYLNVSDLITFVNIQK